MMYHVMIIEDDPMVASINRQYVEATPSFQTDRVFKSGTEALEYLKDHTTDLIILDYYTPLMNGIYSSTGSMPWEKLLQSSWSPPPMTPISSARF